jgi:plastocyanin
MFRPLAALSVLLAIAIGVALRLAAPSTVVAGDPCYHGFEIPERTTADTTEIKLMPCAFGPTVAHVPVGATVSWVNGPDWTHLVTGANQEWGSRDVEIAPNASVSYTFTKAGIYPYACALHRGMSGTIVVGDAPAAARAQAADAAPPETDAAPAVASATPSDAPVLIALAAGAILGTAVTIVVAALATRRHGPIRAG